MIWKLTQNKDWQYLSKTFDWIFDMENTPQDVRFHAEGNVAEHTRMVLNHLENMPFFRNADEQTQEILWTAALLHDVEKRSVTVCEPDGSISSRGHAKQGEKTVRKILFRDIPAPFEIREQIAGLVRYHGLPAWFGERSNINKKLFEASLRVNMKWLKIVSEADVNGRICEDPIKLHEQVEFFKIYCKEQDCWEGPRKFDSAHARFHYFNSEDSHPDYIPYDNFKSEVIMLSGLPGMGKDHFLKTRNFDLPIIGLDDIRRKYKLAPTDKSGNGKVVQEAKEQARVHLRKGQSFVWNATNITRMMRRQLIDLFIAYGAKVKIAYIEKPYDSWMEQNKKREFSVPVSVLENMLHKLEIPQIYEAHEVEYITS